MIRRPPRSTRTDTLFPYPTLFRSNQCLFALHHIADRDVARGAEDPAQLARADRAVHRIDDEDFPEIAGEFGVFAQPVDDVADRHMLDRKSTRLNSSH